MLKILVADDHPLFRFAIINIIKSQYPDCETHETEEIDSTIEFAKKNPDLDLLLLDLNMPGLVKLNGLLELRNQCPTTPVVVVSAEEAKNTILQCIAYGAMGFIAKSLPKDEILNAINSVLNGNIYLPSDVIRSQNDPDPAKPKEHQILPEMLSSLTRRQLMVLKCMTNGDANKQIAYNLDISETTVKSHVSSILKKLGVFNRVQAVLGCGDIDFSRYLK